MEGFSVLFVFNKSEARYFSNPFLFNGIRCCLCIG